MDIGAIGIEWIDQVTFIKFTMAVYNYITQIHQHRLSTDTPAGSHADFSEISCSNGSVHDKVRTVLCNMYMHLRSHVLHQRV